jgi:uncharacterized SAM-binding protein YcdF (DUF218 family)
VNRRFESIGCRSRRIPASPRTWVGLAIVLTISVVISRKSWLNEAARFLVSCDKPQKADLLFVLGGNYAVRAPAAAGLLREGWAPKVLLACEPDPGPGHENFTEITRRILIAHGVSKDRIIEIAPRDGVRSTADEAHALRLYLQTYPKSTILVVTSAFHTRRARLALTRALPGGVHLVMFGVADPDCPGPGWPATTYCRQQIETEWIKLVYYFFTFFG